MALLAPWLAWALALPCGIFSVFLNSSFFHLDASTPLGWLSSVPSSFLLRIEFYLLLEILALSSLFLLRLIQLALRNSSLQKQFVHFS